jgi:membrane protein required for colicin V production
VFHAFVRDATIEYVLGFATVLLGVLVVFALVRMALQGLLAAVGLGVTDRILGSVFGGARAAALLVALVLAGGLTNLPQKPWWREAASAPPLETAALAAKPYLPPQVAKRIRYR